MSELTIDMEGLSNNKARMLPCRGDIDAHTCNQMEAAFNKVIATGVTHIIVDLAEVGYMASRGLGMFLNARKTLDTRGGDLILLAPNDAVKGTIAVLGFDSIFKMVTTEAEATEAANA